MKSLHKLAAAVALGFGVSASSVATAQQAPVDAGLARQQQVQSERQEKRENRQERRQERREQQQANKADKRETKQEREELNNMPKEVRQILRTETQNATNVDYYRVQVENAPFFGAQFTNAEGKRIDLRLNREGQVAHRMDLTQTASAQPGQSAPVQSTPATPTRTPMPTSPTASSGADQVAPESGAAIYRRVEANELPQPVAKAFEAESKNIKPNSDTKFYRTKYGNKLAYEVKYTNNRNEVMAVYVDDNGQVLNRHVSEEDDDRTATAGSAERSERIADRADRAAERAGDRASDRARDRVESREGRSADQSGGNRIKTGRVELNQMPSTVQSQMRRITDGGEDVKYYATKYGSQQAYEAKFKNRNGKDMTVYLDEDGKVLSRGEEGRND